MKLTRWFLCLICSLVFVNVVAADESEEVWLSPSGEPKWEKFTSALFDSKAIAAFDTKPRKTWHVVLGEKTRAELVRDLESIEEVCDQKEDERLSCIVKEPTFELGSSNLGPVYLSPLKTIKLVVVTSKELGLPTEAIKRKEIPHDYFKEKVEAAGYKLCPAEAAVQFILNLHQYTYPIYVGGDGIIGLLAVQPMKPVIFFDNFGNLCVAVRRISQSWNAPRKFIVMKP